MKRFSRIKILAIILVLVFSGSNQNLCRVSAEGESDSVIETKSKIMLSENIDTITTSPGSTLNLKIPVRAVEGTQYMSNPSITLDLTDIPFSQESKVTLTKEGMDKDVTFISNTTTYLNFSLKVNDSAKSGTYKLNINFTALDTSGRIAYDTKLLTPVTIRVKNENAKPSLSVESLSYDDTLKEGDHFNINFNLKNEGQLSAKDVYVSVAGFASDGILPDYSAAKKKLNDFAAGESRAVDLPVYVSEKATDGIKTLTVKLNYCDSSGTKYDDDATSIYIPVSAQASTEDPDYIISDVSQSPTVPVAGGKLSVTFLIQNKGKSDMKDVKITPTNLSNTNFSPVDSEPYKFISVIKGKSKKKVTMKFDVSKKIVEGLNEINLQLSYKNSKGKPITSEPSKIYVLNVQNKEEVVGVPKLIISDFDTGKKDLKAGKDFTFAFDINNTHNSLSANNIKVTLSSDENAFSVTKGSNSFYISGIGPGETVHKNIQLKVKPDCVTKAYPLKVDFEYEYEGMQKLENQISTGLKISEVLNLQVMENSRPTVSNIVVGTWEPPTANTPSNMGFDFYNMGKSILYNVVAKVKSKDFTPTQQTKFIGNVQPGTGNTYEMEVTPNIEGKEGKGTLIISYEDSNGNTYKVPTEFTAYVDAAAKPVMNDTDGKQKEIPKAKKAMVPIWAFVLIQIALFLIGIFGVKKIIIIMYKRKLMKKEEEDF